jgi:esterase
MSVNIHSTVIGKGPDVVLIHGLFGMGSNLGALARALQERYTVHSVDLPNHGRSGWMAGADIPVMAKAVVSWMDDKGLGSVSLVGHSLGGKVSMELSLRNPQRVVALVAADIAPVAYPAHHRAELVALAAVAEAQCNSRAAAGEIMARYLEEDMVIQFLLKNLARQADGYYGWRFNLAEIVRGYDDIRAAIATGAVYTGPVLFIKGGDSSYIQEQHRDDILALFPGVVLKVMPDCGHWLHVQQPRLFNGLVRRFFDQQ